MSVKSFEELSLEGLRDIYSAEQQALTKGLPALAKAAKSPELKAAFKEHIEQSKGQVARLDQIFKKLGESPEGKECSAAKGLIEETEEMISEVEPGPILDAGLIVSAQKFEHYEIASYGSARTFARQMGDEATARLLEETLAEEEETDLRLTSIAEGVINPDAADEHEKPKRASK